MDLAPGTVAYVRGPHGIPVDPPEGARIMAVAGGTGLGGILWLLANTQKAAAQEPLPAERHEH